jgi:hypothetical protein
VWDIRLLRDLVHLWGDAALLFFIPALIVGAVIGRFVGRWLLCVLLSCAAAIALLALTRVQQGFRHPPSLIELLVYSAVFALPPILALASVGYLLGRKLKGRRERRRLTQSSHSALERSIRVGRLLTDLSPLALRTRLVSIATNLVNLSGSSGLSQFSSLRGALSPTFGGAEWRQATKSR